MISIRRTLTLLVMSASPLVAQSTIKGRVVGPELKPIPAALVEIRDTARHRTFTTVTDSAGIFSIRLPEAGSYYIKSSMLGYVENPSRS